MTDTALGSYFTQNKTKPIFWVAVAFCLFQLVMSSFHPLSSQVIRAFHVGFLLLLIYLIYPASPQEGRRTGPISWVLAWAGFGLSFYHWIYEADLTVRAGELIPADWVVGIVTIVLVFEAARRVMGLGLPIICAVFLAYAMFGEYLPGALAHRGFGLDQVVGTLGFGTEGIFGTPTYVSSTYIFLFILFGAFLEQAGMIRLFTDFAMGTVGHTRGGPAKVAVISSGLMGTINGSGVANVVTTGQLTIPLMKQFGYRPAFAGGVEATSSMGGQIMPPVMGAVAFIMAETINVPYLQICIAALIPALLYFTTAFWMVHLEAGRCSLLGLPKDQCPDPFAAIKKQWYLIIPLAGLVGLLFSGFTPLFSGSVGLALTIILIFGVCVASGLPSLPLRMVFWILLGIGCSGFFAYGVGIFFVVIFLLIGLSYAVRQGQDTRSLALKAMVEGARHALPVGIACALVGVIIGVINLTGVAAEVGGKVIGIGEQSLFLALFLTMITCLVLGMGIPTIPNYIITSSLAAPILLELGVPLIVSHMFVFYFGIMADLTPPVALAAFAAAPIAKERGLKISLQAIRVAIAGFIVPYMAVYSPALMLQVGTWLDTTWIVFKALVAIGMWGAGAIGFLLGPLAWWERLWAIGAASLLVVALPITDEIGLGLVALFIVWHYWRQRRIAAGQIAPPTP